MSGSTSAPMVQLPFEAFLRSLLQNAPAGATGSHRTKCPASAQPSPFSSERHAKRTVNLERNGNQYITVKPSITHLAKDTIDFCLGGCGTALKQVVAGLSVVAPEGPSLPPRKVRWVSA